MEVFAAEEQQKGQMEQASKLVKVIRWENIKRLSEELLTALSEVTDVAYLTQQVTKVRARSVFEIDNANGNRAVE